MAVGLGESRVGLDREVVLPDLYLTAHYAAAPIVGIVVRLVVGWIEAVAVLARREDIRPEQVAGMAERIRIVQWRPDGYVVHFAGEVPAGAADEDAVDGLDLRQLGKQVEVVRDPHPLRHQRIVIERDQALSRIVDRATVIIARRVEIPAVAPDLVAAVYVHIIHFDDGGPFKGRGLPATRLQVVRPHPHV